MSPRSLFPLRRGRSVRRGALPAAAALSIASFSFGAASASGAVPDPLETGPYAVMTKTIKAGSVTLPAPAPISPSSHANSDLTTALNAQVYYPAQETGRQWPIVTIEHARHASCLLSDGRTTSTGTCDPGDPGAVPIESYKGYGYLGRLLASHGFIVASIDLNAATPYNATAIDAGDSSVRNALTLAFLDRLRAWNAASETSGYGVGDDLVGKLNFHAIGAIGHSRGASSAIELPKMAQARTARYAIRAVFAIEPGPLPQLSSSYVIDPNGYAQLRNIAYGGLSGSCDNDVGQSHAFDAFAKNKAHAGDETEKTVWVVQGVNHNWMNTVFDDDDSAGTTTSNPACAPSVFNNLRLTHTDQQRVTAGYVGAFFRYNLLRERAFAPLISGEELIAPSMLPQTSGRPGDELVQVSYAPPASRRQAIVMPGGAAPTTIGRDGATLAQEGLAEYDWCHPVGVLDPATYVYSRGRPYNWYTDTFIRLCNGVGNALWDADMDRQLQIGWERPSSLTLALGEAQRDASRFAELSFRTKVRRYDARNPEPNLSNPVAGAAVAQDFDVVVTDTAGRSVTLRVQDYARNALGVPISTLGRPNGAGAPPAWGRTQNALSDVAIPISDLSGLDTSALASIRFVFGGRTASGAIGLSDVMYRGVPEPAVPEPPVDPEPPVTPEPDPPTAPAPAPVTVHVPQPVTTVVTVPGSRPALGRLTMRALGNVDRRGRIRVRVSCTGAVDCGALLRLTIAGRAVTSTTTTIRAGATKTPTLRVPTRRLAAARRARTVRIAITPIGATSGRTVATSARVAPARR